MWLVGVVIRRYIDILIIIINFPYSTCIRSFFGSSILTSLFIFKMFFRSLYYIVRHYSRSTYLIYTFILVYRYYSSDSVLKEFHSDLFLLHRVMSAEGKW